MRKISLDFSHIISHYFTYRRCEVNWENFRLSTRLHVDPSIIEQVYALIAEIDGVKHSWRVVSQIPEKTMQQLKRRTIVTSTGSSCRISKNHLTDLEVGHLYKHLHTTPLQSVEEQEVARYLQCLDFIFQHYKKIPISELSLCKLHSAMLLHREDDQKGVYRSSCHNNAASMKEKTPPHLVKQEMQELIEWYHWSCKNSLKHPLLLIMNFIFEYVAIHPFQSGNGKTSRLLTNLLLLQHGYLFPYIASYESVIASNQLEYHLSLNTAQKSGTHTKEDITPWLLCCLNVIKEQSQEALQLLENDSVEYLLSEKQLALWNWAVTRKANFSRKDAIKALGFPARTIEESIKKLVTLHCLKRLGLGKATRYQLLKEK